MREIPTLFVRDENNRRHVTDQITPGCEWVFTDRGVTATRKYDGTCVMLDEQGRWWARREIKPGKEQPAGFQPIESDTVCTSCKMSGGNPDFGGADAACRSGSEARVSPPVVRGEGRSGSELPQEMERQQRVASGDLRDLRHAVSGPQGQEDLQQVVRGASGKEDATEATGQPEAVAARSGERSQGDDQRAGVPHGLPTGSPARGQQPGSTGTQGRHGDDPGPAAAARGDGAPQERHSGRQPSRESGVVDATAAARRPQQRVSALRDVHLCSVCGVANVTGKSVGWEPIGHSSFSRWHAEAVKAMESEAALAPDDAPLFEPGTYELVGPRVNGNPERYDTHWLIRHEDAAVCMQPPFTVDGVREAVRALHHVDGQEGIVWHHPDGRMAKLKARDFPREDGPRTQ